MAALLNTVLPVFLVVAAGYAVAWAGKISDKTADSLMDYAQNIAIPCLLFLAMAQLNLKSNVEPWFLASFYTGSVCVFFVGLLGARLFFARPWEDSVAIGVCCLLPNTVLIGLPILQRAFPGEAEARAFVIISMHAPFCYAIGITAMEIVRSKSGPGLSAVSAFCRSFATNGPIVGIGLGLAVNLLGLPLPSVAERSISLVAQSGLPVALFGLGSVIFRYRPEGDLPTVFFIVLVSLLLHPLIAFAVGTAGDIPTPALQAAIVLAAACPGINAYLFANQYGVAKRVAATAVLVGTLAAVLSVSLWISLLGAIT